MITNYREEVLGQAAVAFGCLVRRKREEKGWTRTYLAALLDVEAKLVQRWETGKRLPLRRSMEALVEALEITPEEMAHVIPHPPEAGG